MVGADPVKAPPTKLGRKVRAALKGQRDPARAPEMQAYMKSEMPYLGVSAPLRRRCVRSSCRGSPISSQKQFKATILDLWRNAKFREERYAAVDVLVDKKNADFLDLALLPTVEEMIVSGAWWDYVDPLASHAIGRLLSAHPGRMRRKLLSWSKGKNIWKRRTAILSQLSFGTETDDEFLLACIEPSLQEKEFFLQKAIGWALRQRAWSKPAVTRRLVRKLGAQLSPLARREALKNL